MKHKSIGKCRSCEEEIVWMITKKGKNIPVDIDSVDTDHLFAIGPDEKLTFKYGDHVAHFNTCVNAEEHRR
jgi:ribosomal protein L31